MEGNARYMGKSIENNVLIYECFMNDKFDFVNNVYVQECRYKRV